MPSGIVTNTTRKYASASGMLWPGVLSARSSAGANSEPTMPITIEATMQNPSPLPKVVRAPMMSRAPKYWPTRTVVAMPKPNTAANSRNMTTLALAVAASALLPISRPTQIELIEPFSV